MKFFSYFCKTKVIKLKRENGSVTPQYIHKLVFDLSPWKEKGRLLIKFYTNVL